MSLEQHLDVKLDQRLTQEQKLLVQDQILGLRLRLIGKIHGETCAGSASGLKRIFPKNT